MINADTLKPAHCRPQASLPQLLRLGHTQEGQAPVLIPLPHSSSLWLDGARAADVAALAEGWAMQLLLQAPASHFEVHVYDSGLDTSLPTLERLAAMAKAKGLPQRVHFITDPVSLQQQLELWQADARQRKSHLLQAGHADWPSLLDHDPAQPLRLLLLTHLDDLADADRRWSALPPLLQHGPRLGCWFWLLGPAAVPATLRNAHEREQWQAWFDERLQPHLLRFRLNQDTLGLPDAWAAYPIGQVYRAFGQVLADGLGEAERQSVLASHLAQAPQPSGAEPLADVWAVPIGQFQGQPYWFRIGPRSGSLHTLLAGTTGTGKTSFLNLLILRTCEACTPDELQFCLFDLKQGVSFGLFEGVPHVARVHLHEGDYEPVLQVLRDLMAERDRRKRRFLAAAPAGLVPDIGAFNRLARQRGTAPMPVLAVVIDEVQKLFVEGDFTQRREAARLVEEVAREGRAYGFTLLFSSQSYQGVDLPPAAASQFKLRLAFKLAGEADCRRVMGQDNDAPLRLGDWQLLVNDDFGRPQANRTVRVDHIAPEAVYHRLQAVRERWPGRSSTLAPADVAPAVPGGAAPSAHAPYVPGRYGPAPPPVRPTPPSPPTQAASPDD